VGLCIIRETACQTYITFSGPFVSLQVHPVAGSVAAGRLKSHAYTYLALYLGKVSRSNDNVHGLSYCSPHDRNTPLSGASVHTLQSRF
jgi:hypothetical protein